jgi:phosphoenolpyruvate carboxylase
MRWPSCDAHIRRAFPRSATSGGRAHGLSHSPRRRYEIIRRVYIDPIEQAYLLSLRLTTVIANYFGAHG